MNFQSFENAWPLKRRPSPPVLTPKHVDAADARPSPPVQPLPQHDAHLHAHTLPHAAVHKPSLPPSVVMPMEHAPRTHWLTPWHVSPLLAVGIVFLVFTMGLWVLSSKMEVHRLSVQHHELMVAVLQSMRAN